MNEPCLSVGDRVGIYRKSRRIHSGTVLKVVDANDDMTWGHKMSPDWIITVDVDGLGPRRWARGLFRAKDLRRFGATKLKREPGDGEAAE